MEFEMIAAEREPVMVEKNENGLVLVTKKETVAAKKKAVAKAPKELKVEEVDSIWWALFVGLLEAITAIDYIFEKFTESLRESVNSETRHMCDELKMSFNNGTIMLYFFGFLAGLHFTDQLLAAIFIFQKAIYVIGFYLVYCCCATKIRKLMNERPPQRELYDMIEEREKMRKRECKLNREEDDSSVDSSEDSSDDSSDDSEAEVSQDTEFEREVGEEDM